MAQVEVKRQNKNEFDIDIIPEEEGYFSVDWDRVDIGMAELSPERKQRMNKSINRMNQELYNLLLFL